MKDLSKNILDHIERESIRPSSKWKFLLKNDAVWAAFVLAVLVGSVSVSAILYLIVDHDWDVYPQLEKGAGEYVLLSLPYAWIAALALFSALAYYNYKHTKSGYKHKAYVIVLGSVVVSVVIGSAMYAAGFGSKIDRAFAQKMPLYEKALFHRTLIWQNDDYGLLAGEIVEIEDEKIELEDLRGKGWIVIYSEAHLPPEFELEEGLRVKLIGEVEDDVFLAKEIRPFFNPRHHPFKRSYPPAQ